ncbi:hypothetical protein, unlikely [Trypanosoma brucei gambiense DAL972]|uniref:Uncharacterized protein n=1 Tax=Trypanosoma brucei gambiense (strain MHOM/CI/86/DAL972) TaxID=679716 RepID=D0AA74_TRYB9|nr:hypothetical protein, unlikely [Trypanosoma brucei gambiense DAL972]CBH18575.1 hypothetical protein, unlikely [Trypanosoma brucei gambiense DAL972]|eukprot:XP_011780839.1 hypothetical protein, unlikely [Trypanosoma brucei gambiense DAL972]
MELKSLSGLRLIHKDVNCGATVHYFGYTLHGYHLSTEKSSFRRITSEKKVKLSDRMAEGENTVGSAVNKDATYYTMLILVEISSTCEVKRRIEVIHRCTSLTKNSKYIRSPLALFLFVIGSLKSGKRWIVFEIQRRHTPFPLFPITHYLHVPTAAIGYKNSLG